MPFEDAIVPLEAQHQTGGLVDPKHNVKYPLSECPKRNLVSNALKEDLEDAEKTSEDNEDSSSDDEDILVKIKQYQSTLTSLLNDTKKIQSHSIQFKLSCDDFHQLDVGKDFNLICPPDVATMIMSLRLKSVLFFFSEILTAAVFDYADSESEYSFFLVLDTRDATTAAFDR